MEQSEWIQELKEADKEFDKISCGEDNRRFVLQFAESIQHCTDGCGEIAGVLSLLNDASVIEKLDELIGFNLHWLVEFYDEADELTKEDICRKEKAELQLKYCQMIESYDLEYWTPEIKKLFEDGLDFLFNRIEQGATK